MRSARGRDSSLVVQSTAEQRVVEVPAPVMLKVVILGTTVPVAAVADKRIQTGFNIFERIVLWRESENKQRLTEAPVNFF